MKNAVVTIIRNYLDKFEGQYKGYPGWFKIDIALKFFPQFIQNSIKTFSKKY